MEIHVLKQIALYKIYFYIIDFYEFLDIFIQLN